MNDTMEVLLNRYSLRQFKPDKIEPDIIRNILQAGVQAATAGNLQPFSIIQIEEKENSEWFVEQNLQSFIGKAPLNLLFCLDFHRLERWSRLHKAPFVMDKSLRHFWVGFQDVIIAAQTIETAANSYGIGSVYIGTVVEIIPQIQEKFNLPKGVIPIVLLTLGYPTKEGKVANKLPQELLVHHESYQQVDDQTLLDGFYQKYGEPKSKLTSESLEKILSVVESVEGSGRKDEVRQYLADKEYISWPMRYFGLHYVADYMARHNTELLQVLEKNGLIWAKGENHPK